MDVKLVFLDSAGLRAHIVGELIVSAVEVPGLCEVYSVVDSDGSHRRLLENYGHAPGKGVLGPTIATMLNQLGQGLDVPPFCVISIISSINVEGLDPSYLGDSLLIGR